MIAGIKRWVAKLIIRKALKTVSERAGNELQLVAETLVGVATMLVKLAKGKAKYDDVMKALEDLSEAVQWLKDIIEREKTDG